MTKSAQMRLILGIFTTIGVAAASLGAAPSAHAVTTPRVKPAAPGPAYISAADHARLKLVAKAAKAKNFGQVRSYAKLVEDPIGRSLADWLYYMAQDPKVSLKEADAFLDAHADWPAISRIQAHVEKRIKPSTPSQTVLEFFDSRDPVSGDGKLQLARALFETGSKDAAKIHLHDAWVNHNFSVDVERRLLSMYGRRLTQEDHAARVDRLLWARQVTRARRIFSKLNAKNRRMAEARAALLLGAASAPTTYLNLREDERLDSGVLLAAVRHFRRRGDHDRAIELAEQSPKDPQTLRNSSRWWYERQLLMRQALKEGRFADAYKAASHHGLDRGGDFAEAEFNAGWVALRFLNEPQRAETHFLALASAVGTPISLSRAHYWLGRTAEARGLASLSDAHYSAASKYIYTYHGQLAAEKAGGPALENEFSPPTKPSPEDLSLFTSRPTVRALRMLADLDLDYEFMVFAYHIDDQLETPGEYVELGRVLTGEGAPHLTVRAGKVAVRRKAFAPEVAYPVIFVPDEAARYVEPAIILGLSRQESEFNARAFSRAGARGLMQLIPTTAQITARKEGLRYSRAALLNDPIYNMTLGSAHLSHLLARYEGSLIMTFAAYNAGAGRVSQWVETYGDPRSPDVDPLDWVELIPFAETRNYVQRVLENTQVYRARLNDAPIAGRLSADLERGGARRRTAIHDRQPSAVLAAAAAGHASKPLASLPARTLARAEAYRKREEARLMEKEIAPTKQETPRDAAAAVTEASPDTSNAQALAQSVNEPTDASAGERMARPGEMTPEKKAEIDALARKLGGVLDKQLSDESTDEIAVPADVVVNVSIAADENEDTIAVTRDAPVVDATATPVIAPSLNARAPAQQTNASSAADEDAAVRRYRPGEPAPTDNEADDLNAGQLSGVFSSADSNPSTNASIATQEANAQATPSCITYGEFQARSQTLTADNDAAAADALAALAARVGDCD